MDTEMDFLERVAQAMAGETGCCQIRDKDGRCCMTESARKVLEEMREPTFAMVVAGCQHEHMGDMAGRWKAMIDEALK
jgi:hypothetical protein